MTTVKQYIGRDKNDFSPNKRRWLEFIFLLIAIGKKHAFKKYDQFMGFKNSTYLGFIFPLFEIEIKLHLCYDYVSFFRKISNGI